MKLTKKRAAKINAFEADKSYELLECFKLLKEVNLTKFDASVDLHIRLGVDPRKADQAIRGTVVLPNGTGKEKTVLVFCTPDKEEEAKEAGADYVGLDEFIDKIEKGWTDIDVIVATPTVMGKIGKLGRVLGPRNLMPNPKSGTVTLDVANAVKDLKGGKIAFRVDKFGIIHSPIGKVSFTAEQLAENAEELLTTLSKMRPTSVKGIYMKSVFVASTMSPGIQIDLKSVDGL